MAGGIAGNQRFQHLRKRAAQLFPLEELPVVVCRTVAQREACHKVVLVRGRGALKLHQAGSATLWLGTSGAMLVTAGGQSHKGRHIAKCTCAIAQRAFIWLRVRCQAKLNQFAFYTEQGSTAECGVQHRKRAPQCATGVLLVRSRPKQGG